jgi:NAD(P)-dependent dehydrogenase (short-subunit alcohol dehydrogenase family)
VYDAFGRSDLVVNNAALAPPKAALEDSTKRWRLGVDVNVNGPFYLIYYFAPRMAAAGGGRIVNISSGAAQLPSFGRASYTTTKAALEAMTQALGHDLRKQKVAVNCIRLDFRPTWSSPSRIRSSCRTHCSGWRSSPSRTPVRYSRSRSCGRAAW